MNIKNIEKKLTESNQPKYRLVQILKAVFQDNVFEFDQITNIPKDLKEILKDEPIFCFTPIENLESKNFNTKKMVLELEDSNIIETVLIKNSKGGYTACVSSQVGCPLNCAFCATGQNGFIRNLSSEEITDQVLFWKKFIKENKLNGTLTNIVYMGMGEPFLNYENFKKSVKSLTDINLFNISDRAISVSTSFSNIENMKDFFNTFPQVNLAISLHFANDQKRSTYMPINREYGVDSIIDFINKHLEKYNRKILIEYLMLKGINDSERDAEELMGFINAVEKNYLLHLNIIPYNSTYKNFKTTDFKDIIDFENYFKDKGVNITLRKSSGEDIDAACGQLAGKTKR